jgi:hypothetical protein
MKNLIFFNSIKDFWTTTTITDKLQMLFDKSICLVYEKNLLLFEVELGEFDSNLDKQIDFLSRMEYLDFDNQVKREMVDSFLHLINSTNNGASQSFLGVELRSNFKSKLIICHNEIARYKLLKKYMKKALKRIKNIVQFDLNMFFEVNENLNYNNLNSLIEIYYEHHLLDGNSIRDYNKDSNAIIDDVAYLENKEKVIRDLITYVAPEVPVLDITMFDAGYEFFVIRDMLNLIEEFKKELIKIDHNTSKNGGVYRSEFNIQNVLDKKNRRPLLFKNAYGCELFLYVLGQYDLKKPILFWYFYDIFRTYKYISKAKKPKPFIDFINEIYGLTEDRVRRELSNKILDDHINSYKKLEKLFKSEINSKTN